MSRNFKCSRTIRSISIAITLAILLWLPNSSATTGELPFTPGEKLTFQLRWGIIPAGEATLEVLPVKFIGDKPVYHFALTAKSNSFVDLFYKILIPAVLGFMGLYIAIDLRGHLVRGFKGDHEEEEAG